MAVSAVILNGTPVMDLRSDTVNAASTLSGVTGHKADGQSFTGSIAAKVASDVTVSGPTVTIPAGNYGEQVEKTVASGSATAPASISGTSATVSTGTNTLTLTKSVSVTPSVTAGYVSSGTAGNSSVSLTASVTTKGAATITPSESQQTIAANTYLTGAQTISAIPSTYVGSGIARKSSSDLTASGATVTAPAGYYETAATKTVTSGSATAPATISGTAATVTTGTNTLTLTKSVSVTPSVSAGYVSAGTAGNSSVSLQANVTTKAAATITPGTTNQTIASGTYLTGTQTISGDANLVSGNIKDGTSIFGVTGSYTGGSADIATGTLTVASNVNTSTNTTIATTSTIGFTPTKFFFWRSDRSATSNHVNQASFVTIGTAYYVRTMTRYSSNALSTSGNANNWTTQTSGYLYFNSNTVYFRSSSSYILPSGTWYWVAIK